MNNRRDFLLKLGALSYPLVLSKYLNFEKLDDFAQSPVFNWKKVKKAFPIKNYPYLHLNSGSAGVMPTFVQKAVISFLQEMNSKPPYEAWNDWQNIRQSNKEKLAAKLGVAEDELAFLRNTTEGLNNVIFGLSLQKGDEIVLAEHDYPFVLNAVMQRKKREGINVVKLKIDLANASDEQIVLAYKKAVNPRTKALILTHVTHREGRILPIKKISTALQSSGVEIILDAAHSFAHVPFKIPDLGVDYMATSLHKWLNAPHGTGLLYVKKEKIASLFSLQGSYDSQLEQMDKFECLGTRAFYLEIGISAALAFQEDIGWERKYLRLQHLKQYWTNAVKDLDKVTLCTPLNPSQSAAIASFRIKDFPKTLYVLKRKYNIHAKSVGIGNQSFIRITPNVFTLEKDLDQLIEAIFEMSR